MKDLFTLYQEEKVKAYKAVFFSIANKVFDLAPPLLIGAAVEVVVKKEDSFLAHWGVASPWHQLLLIGLLTFIVWSLESLFEYWLKVEWRGLAQDLQNKLRLKSFKHLQGLDMSWFEEENSGNIQSILNDDINQLERFFDSGANSLIQLGTTVILIGIIFFAMSPLLACLAFVPIPFILWGSFFYQKKLAPRYLKVRNEAGLLGTILSNTLQGVAVMKSFAAEEFEFSRLKKQSDSYSKANSKAIALSSAFSPLIRFVVLMGFLFTLILGGHRALNDQMAVGAYSVMVFMTQRLLWPMTSLGETFDLYQRAMASLQRIFGLLQTPSTINNAPEPKKIEDASEIRFKNVSFAYPNGHKVLESIDFHLAPGETIAFVGATGSGKSTIIKLLLRFYDIQSGDILFGSTPIKEIDIESIRGHMSYVGQDHYLFHGSVQENVQYGSFDKTAEDLLKAYRQAEALDFIQDLPQKGETLVGERGQKLSGGQRQRLSLARAILKNSEVFLFDEATSAVDNETEALIQQSLTKITKGKSTIIVAHRLSTIVSADRIYVLDKGQIVESGTHQDLMNASGPYSKLWSVQTGIHSSQT